jgi:hypothetical protein
VDLRGRERGDAFIVSGAQHTPEVELKISIESLERSANGRVFGGLHVQIDGTPFPEADWTDFVVILLGWWCDGLTKLSAAPDQPLEVRFLEGPFLVRIGPIKGSTVQLVPVDTRSGRSRPVPNPAQVAIEPLMQTVLNAAGAIVDECRVRGWISPDIEQLAASRDALARVYRKALN